jgi:hypothetical protein
MKSKTCATGIYREVLFSSSIIIFFSRWYMMIQPEQNSQLKMRNFSCYGNVCGGEHTIVLAA